MDDCDELIHELSELCGILPEYWDVFGKKHTTALDTAKAILKAMGVRVDSADAISKEISERRSRPWKTFLDPVHVLSVNEQPFSTPVYIPLEEGLEAKLIISWSLEDETGRREEYSISGNAVHISEQKWIDSVRYVKVNLVDGKRREIGYYTIQAVCKHSSGVFHGEGGILAGRSKIIITPDTCYLPEELRNGRAWGISVNLYSIRSKKNWGIGDFRDLGKIVRWTSGLKGHFVGINPIHAIPNTRPFGTSPYSPISRLYNNLVYLDIESVPEVKVSKKTREVMATKKFRRELEELKEAEFINYEKAASLKEKILRKAFAGFYKRHVLGKTGRGRSFRKYVKGEGLCLESFAIFMSLREYMKKNKNAYTWQDWPETYRKASGKAVRRFGEENHRELLFYKYVQWLIDGQLRRLAGNARKLGMLVGLYNDLAVGSAGGGSDTWSFQDVLASGSDVGAPPDDFSPEGQKWGFPPIIPERLRETGYELFIMTIRKNMKHAGALRIDHVLGMFRLFWIPDGMTPNDGVYVLYPSEDLLRIIALESVRNRTVVIAEDLGTIGDNVREALKRFWMLSYRLLYFERNYPDPSFLPPERYPLMALCAVTTHDLPTIYGYWKGRDIERRRAIGKYPDDTLWNKQVQERERDKKLILATLKSQGIIPDDYPSDPSDIPEMTPELCSAIYHYLALTPCKLLLASLDDVIGALDQQNMPGTVDSHPNWLQKTRPGLEQIVKDKRFIELSGILNKYLN